MNGETREFTFEDDGRIPNNALPLVLYPAALPAGDLEPAGCRELLASNDWLGAWVNGVFPYHHYHSTSHEALVVVSGAASVTFGGEGGETVEVAAGDAVVIPAGVGHCNRGSSRDFSVVGAYPGGRSWDVLTGEPGERPESLENIQNVPRPENDPLYGEEGPLSRLWRTRTDSDGSKTNRC